MKKLLFLLFIMSFNYNYCQTVINNNPLKQYIATLSNTEKPADQYILDLFNDHDLVIICERFHGEMTQYELFYKIIKNSKFIDSIGYIYTEIGAVNLNTFLQNVLNEQDSNKFKQELLHVYRNLSYDGFWEKSNLYYFLKKVNKLNINLPSNKRITIKFSDVAINWDSINAEEYKSIFENIDLIRDSIMAYNIINDFCALKKINPAQKALVILNSRHAFNFDWNVIPFHNPIDNKNYYSDANTGRYIFEYFKDKVANVFLNTLIDKNDGSQEPLLNGKWDAAFKIKNIDNVGFNFKNTPFGNDTFYFYNSLPHNIKFQDVFTGFVFYKPLKEHYLEYYLPELFNEEFKKEMIKRLKIMSTDSAIIKPFIDFMESDSINIPIIEKYPNLIEINNKIDNWILK